MKKKESGDGVRFFATDDKQPHAVLKEIQAIEMDTNLSIKDKVINKLKVLSRAMNQNDIKLSDIFPSSIFENLDTRVTQEINDTPQEDSSPRQNCF